MGGAIGEWSNSAPRAEPCHWATWAAPIFLEGNSRFSRDSNALEKPSVGIFLWRPLTPPPPSPPLAPSRPCPWPGCSRQGPAQFHAVAKGSRGHLPNFYARLEIGPGPLIPPLASARPGPCWPFLAPTSLRVAGSGAAPNPSWPRQRWELRAPALNPTR